MHNTFSDAILILACFHKKSSGKKTLFLPHRSGTIKNGIKMDKYLCKNYTNQKADYSYCPKKPQNWQKAATAMWNKNVFTRGSDLSTTRIE
jgi:hypothetical protein